MNETVAKFAKHVNPAFVKLLGVLGYGRLFARASGTRVWDREGREYLDLLAGFGAVNVGHSHPRLVRRLEELLRSDPVHLLHVGPSELQGELAGALASLSGLDVALFSSSGSEAVDAAMKLARAATRRSDFVFAENGFHGTSLGPLSLMGAKRLRAPFEPLLPGCRAVPYGDLAALEKALKRAAAFIVEPVQAEGGVVLPPAGYLKGAQELCRRAGALFVLDEVQTGLGRTGSMFAFQHDGLEPDVVVLAKSLGGGIASIGATLTTAAIHRRAYGKTASFDLHGSTFAGSALGCAAALETLAILRDENLVANTAVRSKAMMEGLRRRLEGHPLVREIRGRGLLVGIELGPTDAGWMNRLAPFVVRKVSKAMFGQWAALRLLEAGFIVQPASQAWDVLRLEPPLTIGADEVARAVEAVGAVLDGYRGVAPLVRDVTARLREQRRRGGTFR